MGYVDFITQLHIATKRDYLFRVADKAHCAEVARQFGKDYWDGDRKYGYGGYYYDGRWKSIAQQIIDHYGLKDGQHVLDIGCGKAFLLYEMKQLLPGLEVAGLDVSTYALEHAKDEIKDCLREGSAVSLPYPDKHFDLVLSLHVLHYLYLPQLAQAVAELERVKRGQSYIVLESYRNEQEKANLIHWQLTCECFYTPEEWAWLFDRLGYTGDYSFVFFT